MKIYKIYFILIILFSLIFHLEAKEFDKKSDKKNENEQILIIEDLNLKYKIPEGYKEFNLKKLNPDITFSFTKTNPMIVIMMIAENLGDSSEMDTKSLLEFVKNNVENNLGDLEIFSEKKLKINNMNGYVISYKAKMIGVDLYYNTWVYYNNGYSYQFTIYGPLFNKVDIDKEAEKVFSGFVQIEKNKKSTNKLFYTEKYNSKNFNFSINLKNSSWNYWENIAESSNLAEAGGLLNDNTAFEIIPFMIGYEDANIDLISTVLLQSFDISFKNEKFQSKKRINSNEEKGYILKFKEKNENGTYTYIFKIVISKSFSYLIPIWTTDGNNAIDKYANEVFSMIKINNNFNSQIINNLSNFEKNAQGYLFNQLGIEYYNTGDTHKSLSLFKKAIEIDNTIAVYLDNALECYFNIEKYSEALDYLETLSHPEKNNIKSQLHKARFLKSMGQKKEAYKIYKDIFTNSDYADDVFFVNYLNLIIQEENIEAAKKAYDKYYMNNESLGLAIEFAGLLYQYQDYSTAINILKKSEELYGFNANIGYWLIDNYNAQKQYKESLEICNKLIKENYITADTYYLKGETEYYLKWYREAKKSLETALNLSPNSKNIQAFLTEVSGLIGEGYNSTIKDKIVPVVIPKEIIKSLDKIKTGKDTTDYSSFLISNVKGYFYKKNKILKYTIYREIKVQDAAGVSKFSTIEYDFNPLNEEIYVNSLIIKDKDGKIVSEGNQNNYYIVDKQNNIYADYNKTLYMPVPNLQPEYTIELILTVQNIGDAKEFYFTRDFFSGNNPTLYSSIFITGDINELKYNSINIDKPSILNDTIIWEESHPSFYPNEPLLTYYENYLQMLLLSSNKQDWNTITKEYLNEINDKLKIENEIIDLAKKITLNAKDDNEKIDQIINYVQKNYTYKAIEFGRKAIIPNYGSTIIKNKYGDCKDHALLIHLLLKQAGIKSHLALVNSLFKIDKNIPSLDQFDHMIVYLPDYNSGTFIDGTNKSMDIKILPTQLANKNALILDENNIQFKEISGVDKENCRIVSTRKVELLNNNDIKVIEKNQFYGYYGGFIREFLKQFDPIYHKEQLQFILANNTHNLSISKLEIQNVYDLKENLIINLEYNISEAVFNVNNETFFNIPGIWEKNYLILPKLEDRKSPFEIFYPLSIYSEIELNINNKLNNFQEKSIKSKFGNYTYKITQNNNNYKITYSFNSNNGFFKKDDYNEYVDFLNDSINIFNKKISYKNNK